MTNYPQWQSGPPTGPPQPTSTSKWVLPTIITGAVLLVGAVVVLVILLLNQNQPAATPSPSPSASGSQNTADPTADPTEQPSPSPTPPEQESAAFVSVDLTEPPVASWKLDLTDRFPDGAFAELVFADSSHADYFEQVIALTNRNHLIALDELTGDIQWELDLPYPVSPGECSAFAYWDMLLCPLIGERDNTGIVVQIDMTNGEIVNWTDTLPFVPTMVIAENEDWLVTGYTMGEWDEEALDGAGGTPVELHAWRGWLETLAVEQVWTYTSTQMYVPAGDLSVGAWTNGGALLLYFNEMHTLTNLADGTHIWDNAASVNTDPWGTYASLTADGGYYILQGRQLSVYDLDSTLRYELTLGHGTAAFVDQELLLAGGSAYNAQTGELLYEVGPQWNLQYAHNVYGFAYGSTETHIFHLETGQKLWALPNDFGLTSGYWAEGNHILSTQANNNQIKSHALHTGEVHWTLPLTGAEVEQPISVWAQHPMRPARSYAWVAGERGDTVYAVVLGGLGEGWVLNSLPE